MPFQNKKAMKKNEKDENSMVKKVKSWKKKAWEKFVCDIEKFLEDSNDQLHSTAISNLLKGGDIEDVTSNSSASQQPSCIQAYTNLYSTKGRQFEMAMLHILTTGFGHDVTFKVGVDKFLAHRGILAARSGYFASMFSHSQCWTEKEKTEISLEAVEAKAFGMFLCYTYGLFIDFSKVETICISSLASVADMYNSVYINHAVELYLVKEKCHIFHKPCAECLVGFTEALRFACAYNMTDLKNKCLDWNVQHLHKVWQTEAFCSMPSDLLETCYKSVNDRMDIDNVGDVTLRVDILLGSLTSVKWEKPMVVMAMKLMSDCEKFIAKNLYEIVEGKNWDLLFKGMGCRTEIVERILTVIGSTLTDKNACYQYVAIQTLLTSAKAEEWNPNTPVLQKLFDKIERYLSSSYFAIIHTKGWDILPDEVKVNLGHKTMSGADPKRKPSRKPILSSSKTTIKMTLAKKVASKPSSEKPTKGKLPATTPTERPYIFQGPPPSLSTITAKESFYNVIKEKDTASIVTFYTTSPAS